MADSKEPEAGTKVPRIIQNAGEAVARDIKPALRLMGRIFFNTWLGDQSFIVDVAKDAAKQKRTAPRREQAAAPRREPHRQPASGGPEIIEAEIIEDKSCATCGGSGKLGRPGHEVSCPKCK